MHSHAYSHMHEHSIRQLHAYMITIEIIQQMKWVKKKNQLSTSHTYLKINRNKTTVSIPVGDLVVEVTHQYLFMLYAVIHIIGGGGVGCRMERWPGNIWNGVTSIYSNQYEIKETSIICFFFFKKKKKFILNYLKWEDSHIAFFCSSILSKIIQFHYKLIYAKSSYCVDWAEYGSIDLLTYYGCKNYQSTYLPLFS